MHVSLDFLPQQLNLDPKYYTPHPFNLYLNLVSVFLSPGLCGFLYLAPCLPPVFSLGANTALLPMIDHPGFTSQYFPWHNTLTSIYVVSNGKMSFFFFFWQKKKNCICD